LNIPINKVIWQTNDENFEDLPQRFINNINFWKNKNLGWDHRYFNGEQRKNFLIENGFLKNNLSLDRYNNLKKSWQSNLWRVAVVWQFGGSYADMDSVPALDQCLDKAIFNANSLKKPYTIICTRDENHLGMGCNNANFIAPKNSDFLKSVLDKYLKVLNSDYDYLNDAQIKERIERTMPNITFGLESIYREDAAFIFDGVLHGSSFKP
jgi:mannosyltransferase OCH1-like enzyme